MNRTFSLIAAALLLSGCSSLTGLLTFEDEEAPVPLAQVATPAPPPATVANDWCQRVAASERLRAQENGFDAATLDRMALQSYQQCQALGAR